VSERLAAPNFRRIATAVPQADEVVVLEPGTPVLRVHPLRGPHPSAWHEFRSFGPTGSRFDHHPPPPRRHPTRSVLYGTLGPEAFTAAIAEFFQDDNGGVGPIDRLRATPAATVFSVRSPVRLLDLRSGWVTRAGGNQALSAGRRSRAREWARAIYRAHLDVQGLLYASSVWPPGACIVLWERARSAMPVGNDLHRTLADPALDAPVADAAVRLGTLLVP
jgi:hypothetical protein